MESGHGGPEKEGRHRVWQSPIWEAILASQGIYCEKLIVCEYNRVYSPEVIYKAEYV